MKCFSGVQRDRTKDGPFPLKNLLNMYLVQGGKAFEWKASLENADRCELPRPSLIRHCQAC